MPKIQVNQEDLNKHLRHKEQEAYDEFGDFIWKMHNDGIDVHIPNSLLVQLNHRLDNQIPENGNLVINDGDTTIFKGEPQRTPFTAPPLF